MKILKITFQNLNSLKGEHSIDLDAGLLSEAGIFSITGPTGAGKSTILDAITLALFGKAARYESEVNPGEMMTRGTGECAAEVLFECCKGRYRAKWTRARARKKPDGKLQNPKREISDAEGQILAEKLRDADTLVTELTGLDYPRFLRSVLLAQGRFREFLDAGDNERGDLLERITGTGIYSEIGKKAYEIEREQAEGIRIARQKLEGVQLKSDEELTTLKEEETSKRTEVANKQKQLKEFHSTLQVFKHAQILSKELQSSEAALEKCLEQQASFYPQAKQLDLHEATQPFQESLIQIDAQTQQSKDLHTEAEDAAGTAKETQQTASSQLAATEQHVNKQIAFTAEAVKKLEVQQAHTTEQSTEIQNWLKAHSKDAKLESVLGALRPIGEDARQKANELKTHEAELQKYLQAHIASEKEKKLKQAQLETAEEALKTAKSALQSTTEQFTKATDGKPIEDWRKLAKQAGEASQQAKLIHSDRQQWLSAEQSLAEKAKALPELEKQLITANKATESAQATLNKEKGILEDKQTIYEQAQVIASLDKHRSKLIKNQPCPLCGSTEHPYAENLKSDEQAEKKAVSEQKKVVEAADKLRQIEYSKASRLDENVSSLQQEVEQQTKRIKIQGAELSQRAQTAGFTDSIGAAGAFSKWLTDLDQAQAVTEDKLAQIEALKDAQAKDSELFSKAEGKHSAARDRVKDAQDKQADLAKQIQANQTAQERTTQAIQTALQQFNQHLNGHLAPIEQVAATLDSTQQIEARYKNYQKQVDASIKLVNKLKELEAQLKDLNKEYTRLESEVLHWKEELQKLETQPAESGAELMIADSESVRRTQCQQALDAAKTAQEALKQKTAAYKKASLSMRQLVDELVERVEASQFDSLVALRAARLDTATLASLKEKKERLKTQHDTLKGRIEKTKEELAELKEQELPDAETVAKLKVESEALSKQVDSQNQRIGEITTLLKQDAAARVAQAEQIKQIEKLQADARPWVELNALIGSANGDKFSKFAQGLTLAQLLQLANRHLLELNDRYQIRRTEGSDLGLEIIDRYQADAIRPTKSLSGGESFLVSLALALGLSDLTGSNTRIESLFIDEGFGTLDAGTLDIALAALENLRMSNRTIGIISHVDALKQRISAQIKVFKGNNGYGKLEVCNGS